MAKRVRRSERRAAAWRSRCAACGSRFCTRTWASAAPSGSWSLLTETSESPERPVNQSTLAARALGALQSANLIPQRCEIVSTWQHRIDYGYPVPYLYRDEHVHAVDAFLMKHGIYSRGRFGAWKYEVANQDHSCAQGVEAGECSLVRAVHSL